MTVKRYDFALSWVDGEPGIVRHENPNGTWVLYGDYTALEANCQQLADQITAFSDAWGRLEKKHNELVAAVRDAIDHGFCQTTKDRLRAIAGEEV